MKKYLNSKSILTAVVCLSVLGGCKKEFLDFKPTGVVSDAELNTVENAEKMVIAAYASLGNDGLLAHNTKTCGCTAVCARMMP